MQAVLDIVLPVFGLILLGYLVARTPLLNEERIKGLGNFVFYVAIPALLFRSMSRLEVPESVDPLMLAAYFGAAAAVWSAGFVLARAGFRLPADQAAVMAMGCCYSNLVLLGIPIGFLTFGDKGLIGMLLILSLNPLFLISLPTIIIEAVRGRQTALGRSLLTIVWGLVKNPVILSMIAGLLWGTTGLGLPSPIATVADLLKAAAAPTALFAVGASLTGFRIAGDTAQSVTVVFVKLLVFPALVWLLAAQIIGLSPFWTSVVTLAAAMPTGVNMFLLASAYDVYAARSASVVLISTAVSVFTIGTLIALVGPPG